MILKGSYSAWAWALPTLASLDDEDDTKGLMI
jgi:hypothetical protein